MFVSVDLGGAEVSVSCFQSCVVEDGCSDDREQGHVRKILTPRKYALSPGPDLVLPDL